MTFPAASIFWFPLAYVPGVTDRVYTSQAEMVDHVIELEREQVAEAIAAGATYVQFDWPLYPLLGDDFDIDQLALCPQCGFASTMHGNEIDEDVQWRKLETLVQAADKIWPR